MGREGQDGLEVENLGADVMEVHEAGGVDEDPGWRQEDEGFVEAGGELGDGAAKRGFVVLDREDDGDGFAGPGSDLFGVGRLEVGDGWGAVERFGDGVAEAAPVHHERSDFFDGEEDIGAAFVRAVAGGDGAGVVVAENYVMIAAAFAGADDVLYWGGAWVEAEICKIGEVVAEVFVPDCREGAERGEPFERFPKLLWHGEAGLVD